jgi:hypothetical protein
VLVLSLAGGRARRALTEGELYPFHDLGHREIAEEESEVTTRELARSRTARKNLWIDLEGDSRRESRKRADLARRAYRTIL